MKAYSLDLLTLNVIDHTQWCYWWGQCFAPLGPILWCLWLFHIYLFSLIWKNQHTILLLNRSGINYHINSMSESYNHNYHWKQIFVLSCLVCKTLLFFTKFSSVQSLSHVRLFATPWIAACQVPVHHQLPEFTQTHVHRVSDAIQPSHPLSSPSPPAPNPSHDQGLFQWVNSSHEVAKVLEFQLSYHSFQGNPRADLLQNGLVGSPCSPRDSQDSSPTPQFKSISSSYSILKSRDITLLDKGP